MLKEHETLFRRLIIAVDVAVMCVCFFISYYLRGQIPQISDMFPEIYYPIYTYTSQLPLAAVIWAWMLNVSGAYQQFRGREFAGIIAGIVQATFFSIIIFSCVAYVMKMQYLSRSFIITTFVLSGIGIIIERIILIRMLENARRRGMNHRYLLVVGTGKRAQVFIDLVNQHAEWGFRIMGLVDDYPEMVGKKIKGYPVIGVIADIPKILENKVIDEVVFVVPRTWLGKIENPVLYCEQVGKRVSIAMDLFNLNFAKLRQSGFSDFPLLMFQSTSDKLLQLMFKRVLDFVVSGALIVVLSPAFLFTALAVKWTSPGPILFTQVRSGLNGRVFKLFKFRTMVVDAEAKLAALQKHNEMSGPVFKMTEDPRITPVGKWLRKLSLDELPQLFNVLSGDMSLVGPRPPIPAEVEKYEIWHRRRLSMRPGITGLWQTSGRNKITKFEDWMKLDLKYIDQWSLWLDLKIFLKTVPVVAFGIGAK